MKNIAKKFARAEARMAQLRPFDRKLPPLHKTQLPFHPSPKEDPDFNSDIVTRAVYGWRRDYGEWPTWANAVDRIAEARGFSHAEAARRLAFALNDPSSVHEVYAIHKAVPSQAVYSSNEMRLFVDPADLYKLYDTVYTMTRFWHPVSAA